MELKNFFAQDASGNVIPSPRVSLFNWGTTTLVTGLQDVAGAALPNPFDGSAEGQVQFAAPKGDYLLRIEGANRKLEMRMRFGADIDLTPDDLVAIKAVPAQVAKVENVARAMAPLASATVRTNNATETIYDITVPDGFDPQVQGAIFQFAVPETSKGAAVGAYVNGDPRAIFMVVTQQFRQGWLVTLRTNNGGRKWDLVSQVANGQSVATVERTALSSQATLAAVIGVDAVAITVGGNPNEIYVDLNNWVNDYEFRIYNTATNTDFMIINFSDGRRCSIVDSFADGKGRLTKGTVSRLVVSFGGNNVIWRETTALNSMLQLAGDKTDLVSKFARDFHANQWLLTGSALPFVITAAGSSVTTEISRNRAGATDYAPSHRLSDKLNTGRIRGNVVVDDNWSHGGHVISQFYSQMMESTHWQEGRTRALFLAPGPNDWRVAGYHTGQTLPGGITVLESLVLLAKSRGIPTIILLPFDPDVSQENYGSFFTNNTTIRQQYPSDVAAPVNVNPSSPTTGMHPSANDSVGTADMTGRGVAIPYDRRFEHGATLVRDMAARYPECVVLIDSRRRFHRVVEGLMPDAYGKRVLYGTGDPIHPLRRAHDEGFDPPLAEFAQDLLSGRPIKRIYDGL